MNESKPIHKRAKGKIGEDAACTFLEKKGFTVIDRNYQKKWGELDIVAIKDKILHFFEVKSVTSALMDNLLNSHRPEDNVDGWKIKHLRRIIETYLDEKGDGLDSEFQFHVLCVYMDMNTRLAKIKWLENLIL
ncbi:MAG: YraN family protein [Candidatus Taylorbacteria bacterium]|nr:YraN family protein [Candidatus Taylorbacteria bacterium]